MPVRQNNGRRSRDPIVITRIQAKDIRKEMNTSKNRHHLITEDIKKKF